MNILDVSITAKCLLAQLKALTSCNWCGDEAPVDIEYEKGNILIQRALNEAEARGAERERKRCVEIVKMATDDWASFDRIRKQIQQQSPPDKEAENDC